MKKNVRRICNDKNYTITFIWHQIKFEAARTIKAFLGFKLIEKRTIWFKFNDDLLRKQA
jgi:hypothetical protein